MPGHQGANPEIKWDNGTWFVTFPVENGRVVEASWKPRVTYVVRIRETGSGLDWSFGFETPITSFTFVDLKPDTEYEVQVRTRNASGEGPPVCFTIRTNPTGNTGNIIPFPRH